MRPWSGIPSFGPRYWCAELAIWYASLLASSDCGVEGALFNIYKISDSKVSLHSGIVQLTYLL
jgi:hypothetical protein